MEDIIGSFKQLIIDIFLLLRSVGCSFVLYCSKDNVAAYCSKGMRAKALFTGVEELHGSSSHPGKKLVPIFLPGHIPRTQLQPSSGTSIGEKTGHLHM